MVVRRAVLTAYHITANNESAHSYNDLQWSITATSMSMLTCNRLQLSITAKGIWKLYLIICDINAKHSLLLILRVKNITITLAAVRAVIELLKLVARPLFMLNSNCYCRSIEYYLCTYCC